MLFFFICLSHFVILTRLLEGRWGSCERDFTCETPETYLDPPLQSYTVVYYRGLLWKL